jgi:hypothetical protein
VTAAWRVQVGPQGHFSCMAANIGQPLGNLLVLVNHTPWWKLSGSSMLFIWSWDPSKQVCVFDLAMFGSYVVVDWASQGLLPPTIQTSPATFCFWTDQTSGCKDYIQTRGPRLLTWMCHLMSLEVLQDLSIHCHPTHLHPSSHFWNRCAWDLEARRASSPGSQAFNVWILESELYLNQNHFGDFFFTSFFNIHQFCIAITNKSLKKVDLVFP